LEFRHIIPFAWIDSPCILYNNSQGNRWLSPHIERILGGQLS
jgi:hypothetical protein